MARIDFDSHIRDPYAHHMNIVVTGKVWVNDVAQGTHTMNIDVDFPIHSGLSWLPCAYDPDAEYGTRCYHADCWIELDDDGNIEPYDPITGFGCKITYAVTAGGNDWRLQIAYILFSSGFLPSNEYQYEVHY